MAPSPEAGGRVGQEPTPIGLEGKVKSGARAKTSSRGERQQPEGPLQSALRRSWKLGTGQRSKSDKILR